MVDFDYGITLGALNSTHIEEIRAWRNNPAIMRWCRQTDLISDLDQENWFKTQNADPKIKMYSVYFGTALVGVAGFTSIDMLARHAEFSLYIAPKFHGKGYGKKALKTLFSHGFSTLGFSQIWGEVLDGNPALKMFESVGMRVDGRRRSVYFKEGRLHDSTLVSVFSEEFRK